MKSTFYLRRLVLRIQHAAVIAAMVLIASACSSTSNNRELTTPSVIEVPSERAQRLIESGAISKEDFNSKSGIILWAWLTKAWKFFTDVVLPIAIADLNGAAVGGTAGGAVGNPVAGAIIGCVIFYRKGNSR